PPAVAAPLPPFGRLPEPGRPRPAVRDQRRSAAPAPPAARGGGGAGRGDPGRADRGVPRRVPPRGRHHADLAVPAATALTATVAAVPARARRAVRERGLLVERPVAARPGRRVPQPVGRRRGDRARRAQVAVLHGAL